MSWHDSPSSQSLSKHNSLDVYQEAIPGLNHLSRQNQFLKKELRFEMEEDTEAESSQPRSSSTLQWIHDCIKRFGSLFLHKEWVFNLVSIQHSANFTHHWSLKFQMNIASIRFLLILKSIWFDDTTQQRLRQQLKQHFELIMLLNRSLKRLNLSLVIEQLVKRLHSRFIWHPFQNII